jgi:DNA-binding GntR family transcriptional regulator
MAKLSQVDLIHLRLGAMARNRTGAKPKYQAIVDDVRAKIAGGMLAAGAQLPTKPAMMAQYDASLGVVNQALRVLRDTGLVVTYQGIGSFVDEQPGLVSLDESEWRASIERRVGELEAHVEDLRANAGLAEQPRPSYNAAESR